MLPHLKTILQTNLLYLSRSNTHAKFERVDVLLSALFKDSYLKKVLFNSLNDTGIGVAKKSLT